MSVKPVTARTQFTPTLFGKRLYLHGEHMVYDIAGSMSEDYNGGLWEYVANEDKSVMFMYPMMEGTLNVKAQNYYSGTLSPEAFGIVCTLYALNRLMFNEMPEPMLENLVEKFYALRDFASTHEEADEIFAAID